MGVGEGWNVETDTMFHLLVLDEETGGTQDDILIGGPWRRTVESDLPEAVRTKVDAQDIVDKALYHPSEDFC